MIRQLLGIDPEAQVAWQGLELRSDLPVGLLAGLLVASLVFSFLVYRREKTLGLFERIGLTLLRLVVLALLVFVLFQPVANVEVTESIRPNVLILVDESESMGIRESRTEPADLVEAGMALGLLPFEDTAAYESLHQARVSMQSAASHLRRGRGEQALQDQRQALSALESLDASLRQEAPGGNLSFELSQPMQDLLRGQRGLLNDPSMEQSRDLGELAQRQQNLVAGVEELRPLLQRRNAVVPDALKEKLSGVTRDELAHALMTGESFPLVQTLSQWAQVRTFRFAGDVVSADPDGPWEPIASDSESGVNPSSTRLGGALRVATDRVSGLPVAGIIVLTDGASNAGIDPLGVAESLGRQGIGIYPVEVGLSSPDDLSLRALVAQEVVFSGDLVPVRVQVLSSGYENRSTLLSVLLDGRKVAGRTIVLTGKPQLEELSFQLDAPSGTHKLAVQIQSLGDEAVQENNTIERSIRVVDEKIRVLCIEGSPRWEFRYLRGILKRDPRIEVKFLTTEGDRALARASKEHIARFPEDADEAFSYDLVILGDVRATTFTPAQRQRMNELVFQRGGSMIFLAGPKHMPAEYIGTTIDEMMPVWPKEGQWEEVSQEVYPVLTEAGQRSTVMQLEAGESLNKTVWSKVKPLKRVPAILSAKNTAIVLAVLSDAARRGEEMPLIAWHRHGAGKVMFVGTDRLWRMRAKTGDEYHTRFWSQAIQFLTLSRLLGENSRINFEVSPKEVPVGEPVEVFANVLNESYEPASGPAVEALVSQPEQTEGAAPAPRQRVTLRAVPNMPGLYQGLYTPRAPGTYQIHAQEYQQDISNTVEFTAEEGAAERMQAAAQSQKLSKIAQLSGGRYLSIRELPLLPGALEGTATSRTTTMQVELWDTWAIVVAFVLLTGIEWAWRRRRDMA
jgi:hypothetical protein